jgi:hypothetical protein
VPPPEPTPDGGFFLGFPHHHIGWISIYRACNASLQTALSADTS